MSTATFVRDASGRAVLVACPGCRAPRVLRVVVMSPEEARAWRAGEGMVFATAALLPPSQRASAMRRDAQAENAPLALSAVSCTSCGTDLLYVFQPEDLANGALSAYVATCDQIKAGGAL